MQTITIDIINEKVLQLLKELEQMRFIRLRKEKTAQENSIDWAAKYKGAMSKQSLTDVDKQLNDLRGEWE